MTHSTQASKTSPLALPPPWDKLLAIGTRVLVWSLLFGILYLLHSFFLLIFLTFVFAYIQSRGIRRLEKFIPPRTPRVALVATSLLVVFIVTGLYLVPKVQTQTKIFLNQFGTYIARVDQELYKLGEQYPLLQEATLKLAPENSPTQAKKSPTITIIEQFLGVVEEDDDAKNVAQVISTVRGVSLNVAAIGSAFLLSLLFSFLIVLDFPQLSQSVADLEHTKVGFIYVEVVDNLKEFAEVLGRALEAQLSIAIVNSLLTALGLQLLGLGASVAFLSVIVFFCSFIPVAGVFISATPIALIALQTLGVKTMFLSLALIIFIHMVEGYVLNPKIYGSFMRINPVIVLIILTIGGKLFHLWGLILGVPICTYIFGYAIRFKPQTSHP
jgi:predicted PurR-regulated permease PerM